MAFADLRVVAEVRRLGLRGSEEDALRRAGSLLRERLPGWALAAAVTDLLDRLTGAALHGGWSPAELANAVARIVGEGHETVLAGWWGLPARVVRSVPWPGRRRPRHSAGQGRSVSIGSRTLRSRSAWRLCSRCCPFRRSPRAGGPRPPPSRRTRGSAQLAKVRALLAKAEATTFADEAEALSAKAQELISKHSLEQLLQHEADRATDAQTLAFYRRLWLDSPYVDAKANLVDQIASANRCRAVYA